MAATRISKAFYKSFFETFKNRSGYIGSLLQNASGTTVFEFEFNTKNTTEEALEYLTASKVKFVKNSINPKKVLVKL